MQSLRLQSQYRVILYNIFTLDIVLSYFSTVFSESRPLINWGNSICQLRNNFQGQCRSFIEIYLIFLTPLLFPKTIGLYIHALNASVIS